MAGGVKVGRESCTNAKAKYSSSVVSPDPSVHFYHCPRPLDLRGLLLRERRGWEGKDLR